MQYVMATSFLFMIFSDYLASSGQTISCGDTKFSSADLYNFAKSQASVIFMSVVASYVSVGVRYR